MRKGSPTISPAMAGRQSNLFVDVVEFGRVFRSVSIRQFRRSAGAGIVLSLPSDEIRETIKRAVPAINYLGASTYREALDENLMAALSNKQTAEETGADDLDGVGQRFAPFGVEEIIKASMPA